MLARERGKGSLGKRLLVAQDRKTMQRIEAGKPLIKFNHCKKYIYSFSVPQCCPLCQQVMGSRKLEEAPVSICNPFTNGHQEKCSFLLRPTQGTFLRYSVFLSVILSDSVNFSFCVVATKTFSLKIYLF